MASSNAIRSLDMDTPLGMWDPSIQFTAAGKKCREASPHQLADGLAVVKQLRGPAREIEQLLFGVDAQRVVDRAQDVLRPHWPAPRAFAPAVGFAHHLPTTDSAGEQGKAGVRPVVAAILRDFRSASELAPDQHQHLPVESAFVQ